MYRYWETQRGKIRGWDTHRDEAQTYKIQYPSTWSIDKNFSGITFTSGDFQTEELTNEFSISPIEVKAGSILNLTIYNIPTESDWPSWCSEYWATKLEKCSWKHWAARFATSSKELIKNFVNFQGREVYKREDEHHDTISIIISFPDPKEIKLFEFEFRAIEKAKARDLQVFNKILSSFKFLQ